MHFPVDQRKKRPPTPACSMAPTNITLQRRNRACRFQLPLVPMVIGSACWKGYGLLWTNCQVQCTILELLINALCIHSQLMANASHFVSVWQHPPCSWLAFIQAETVSSTLARFVNRSQVRFVVLRHEGCRQFVNQLWRVYHSSGCDIPTVPALTFLRVLRKYY